jgi:hypothetical protein
VAILASADAKKVRCTHNREISRRMPRTTTKTRARIFIEGLKPAPALGFMAFGVRRIAVQCKGRLDVYTSIVIEKYASTASLSTCDSSAYVVRELLVSHQKIVDTRFRQ